MTRSAIEALADLAQPRAYWIDLLTRAGERGLEQQRHDEVGNVEKARQRCRFLMEYSLHGRHPRNLSPKRTIDKLVSRLVADYRREFSEEISAYKAHRNGERACNRSACFQCRPRRTPFWLDWRAQREKRRAEIRKERRQRRKQKKQRARAKKSRRKNR